MIGRLRGTLAELGGGLALIDVGGVGYEVHVPDSVGFTLPEIGGEAELAIRQIFREDGVTLYGFADRRQRQLFDLLMEVKGCGPRAALSLLGTVGEESIIQAILAQDAKILARATGVGARLSERILLELREKVQDLALLHKIEAATAKPTARSADRELVEALMALGYRKSEAETAAAEAQGSSVEERLRDALKRAAS